MYCPNCGHKQPPQPVERHTLEDEGQAFDIAYFDLECDNCGARGQIEFYEGGTNA